jgi:hypothetical protein
MLAPGRLATEDDVTSDQFPRQSESTAAALNAKGLAVSAVRLAPSVHGRGDHGFVHMLIELARQTGVSAYVGEGLNRGPGVHRLDAAWLYRLAIEQGAAGAAYHGVAEEGRRSRT